MAEKQWYEEYEQVRTPDKERISKIVQRLKGPERTAAEFAEATGLTTAMLSRIINGKYAKPITVDVLAKLAGEDRDTLDMLLRANGMISPEMKEKRQSDPMFARRNEMFERERDMMSIVSNELFERGVLMRKVSRGINSINTVTGSRFFTSEIRSRFAVEMLDTNRSYVWHFMFITGSIKPDSEPMETRWYTQRMIERYSYLFLQDAWEPELLKNQKLSFAFCDRSYFEQFIEAMQDAKLHNRMSAILVDIENAKVVEEKSLVCSDFQDMSSLFSRPLISDETVNEGQCSYFPFYSNDHMEDNE